MKEKVKILGMLEVMHVCLFTALAAMLKRHTALVIWRTRRRQPHSAAQGLGASYEPRPATRLICAPRSAGEKTREDKFIAAESWTAKPAPHACKACTACAAARACADSASGHLAYGFGAGAAQQGCSSDAAAMQQQRAARVY